ncbi:MAG: hypothetical protein GC152_08130 [Alphaproteobacteria bacterium]|nr:hypothetical protein [Alphaproteobacteria bacterium]
MTIEIELDPLKQTVRLGEAETKLPDYSFRLLELLTSNAPNPVHFDDIESAVWGAQVTRETIKQRVRLVRKALAEIGAPADAIVAAHGVGYRLTIPPRQLRGHFGSTAPVKRSRLSPVIIAFGFVALIFATVLLARPDTNNRKDSVRIAVLNELAIRDPEQFDKSLWFDANRRLAGQLSQLQGVDALATLSSGAISSVRARDIAKDLSTDIIISSALIERNGDKIASYQLIHGLTEEILWADEYRFSENFAERAVPHFVRNVKLALARNGALFQRASALSADSFSRDAFFEALELSAMPSELNLNAAIAKLDSVIERDGSFALARGLRAQLTADLIIRHGASSERAADALRDARAAIAQEPAFAELKYALARAELAAGDDHAALAHLQEASHYLPFLDRDIQALEKRIAWIVE